MTSLPLVGGQIDARSITVPGIPQPPEGHGGPNTAYVNVGPSFFETMQIPILTGRPIGDRDVEGSQSVAVVNEVFATTYFAGVSPIGRHFGFGSGKNLVDLEIVGVAKDARYNSLKQQIPPVTYWSFMQEPATTRPHEMYFELRTAGDPLTLANTVRRIVHEAAPQVPVADLTTQAQRIDQTIVQERTFAELCSCFGVLALVDRVRGPLWNHGLRGGASHR